MKNLIYYTINLLFLGLFFISCEEESLVTSFGSSEGTTLTLKLSSRATVTNQNPVSGEDSYNENVIKSISCFLYPLGKSLTETDKDNIVAKHNLNVSDDNTLGEQTVTITLDNNDKKLLFPNGTDGEQCDIYVIANLTTTEKDNVVNLKKTAITASFDEKDIQTSFVMDGDVEKVILNGNKIATPDNNPYNLQRAASKIKLSVTKILNQVEDAAGNKWIPAYVEEKTTDENGNVTTAKYLPMYLRFFNGVKDATIDVGTGRPTNTAITDNSYFSIKKIGNQGSDRNMMALVGSTNNNWISLTDINNIPFYSYSSNWENAENKESYLALIVPWKNGNTVKNCYYQIPINSVGTETHPANCLERNTYYQINLEVGMLGSFDPEEPLVLDKASYVITEWVPEAVNVELNNYRYLIVDKNFTIYNENDIYIPYATSHDVEIVSVTCKQMDLALQIPEWKYANYDELKLTEDNNIYFKNILDNSYISETFDFSPYKITFTIRHEDATNYYETITITQYPAIYGEPYMNSDWTTTGTNSQKHDKGGYLFVNGYNDDIVAKPNPTNATQFCSTPGMGGDEVLNWASPNMYVFTITSIEGTDYVIGDPRETSVTYDGTDKKWNSNDNVVWANGPVLINGTVGNTSRTIKYYYGTDDSKRTENMIAPKFRIASGYAVLGTGYNDSRYLEALKMRCASYQEDGYPAGRWRLPTKAEFEFIIYQTNKGRLPDIFKDGTTYWCAHGAGSVNGDKVNINNVTSVNQNGYSTRCVYDEWYWTDKLETEEQKQVFTWGDAERK